MLRDVEHLTNSAEFHRAVDGARRWLFDRQTGSRQDHHRDHMKQLATTSGPRGPIALVEVARPEIAI